MLMSANVQDPGAGRLAQVMALKSRQQPGSKQQQAKAPGKQLTEDEQIAMALAASMEQGTCACV